MAERIRKKGLIGKLGLPQVAPPWDLGETVLTLAVLFICTLMIGTGVTATISTSTTNPDPISLLMGWLIGLVIIFVFVLVRWRRTPEHFNALKLQLESWQPLLAVMVGVGGAFTASLIVGLGSGNFLAPVQVLGIDNSNLGSLALVAMFVLLVQPLAESLVFAGVILPRLRASLSSWGGLLLTIILYTVFYYLVFASARILGGNLIWYGIVYPIVTSFTFCAVRIWSQSTLTSMLSHIGIGASVLVIMLVT